MQNFLYYVRKYGKDTILFLLLLLCLGLLLYHTFFKEEKSSHEINEVSLASIEPIKEEINEDVIIKEFYVDVKGAVKKPGVYLARENSIIQDVITLAGGFKSNAYQNGINLSKKVKDEMVIYVYTKNEMEQVKKEDTSSSLTSTETCVAPDYSIWECVDKQVSIIETDENSTSTNHEENKKLININTASIQELMSLSGIGESKAEAIIKYREENGNFKMITDIMNVTGIGESVFAKIQDFITI